MVNPLAVEDGSEQLCHRLLTWRNLAALDQPQHPHGGGGYKIVGHVTVADQRGHPPRECRRLALVEPYESRQHVLVLLCCILPHRLEHCFAPYYIISAATADANASCLHLNQNKKAYRAPMCMVDLK